jgi:hypothetical protein
MFSLCSSSLFLEIKRRCWIDRWSPTPFMSCDISCRSTKAISILIENSYKMYECLVSIKGDLMIKVSLKLMSNKLYIF